MKRRAYRSRHIKRHRRSAKAMAELRKTICECVEVDQPMTVRQIFYRLVSQGAIPKTENAYKNIVVRLLTQMRMDREIPFGWIADNTRWMRKPRTYSSVEELLRDTARTYRRSVWDDQEAYIEIWLEKEALAGVLVEETATWDVPLMVTRGYSSLSFLYEAAQHILEENKPTYLYYFGDHDPSGLDIPRNVQSRLEELTGYEADIHFERVAVTPEQIVSMNLPTRPTKQSDSRSKDFVGGSVEVDAIPPQALRDIARECITQHIDPDTYRQLGIVEQSERDALEQLAARGLTPGDDSQDFLR